MHMGCIVIACNSGGPLESVDDGKTGYLVEPKEELWGQKIFDILKPDTPGSVLQSQKISQLKTYARLRVKDKFVMEVFANELDKIMKSMKDRNRIWYILISLQMMIFALAILVLGPLVLLKQIIRALL
mmetsp:Transcript_17383/g.29246  ORF Transcript_17383/g.29246 Transcript_17383/m.29246 type:complete len:128 (-) Transcript_17383:31-414(-)